MLCRFGTSSVLADGGARPETELTSRPTHVEVSGLQVVHLRISCLLVNRALVWKTTLGAVADLLLKSLSVREIGTLVLMLYSDPLVLVSMGS